MADRTGIFAGDDPFALFRDWMAAAAQAEPNDPDAVALATADAGGLPNVRIVLLKRIAKDALVFFTNYHSAKGMELDAGGQAAIVCHWKSLRRQVRARGGVARLPAEASDAYYDSRPLDSRLGAWASRQSRPLDDRGTLEAAVAAAQERFGDAPPRPPHWGGYALVPTQMEFWADGPHRLHDRFRWTRAAPGEPWQITRLYP